MQNPDNQASRYQGTLSHHRRTYFRNIDVHNEMYRWYEPISMKPSWLGCK